MKRNKTTSVIEIYDVHSDRLPITAIFMLDLHTQMKAVKVNNDKQYVPSLDVHQNAPFCNHVYVHVICFSEHHRTRLVCENERLKLMCKNETVLAIYSATFGHLLHGSPYCPQEPGPQTDMGLKQGASVSPSCKIL